MLPQVTFRGLVPTQAIVDAVWRSARLLCAAAPQLEECHVVVEVKPQDALRCTRYRVSLHTSGSHCEHEFRTSHATDSDVLDAVAKAFAATHRNMRAYLTTPSLRRSAAAAVLH